VSFSLVLFDAQAPFSGLAGSASMLARRFRLVRYLFNCQLACSPASVACVLYGPWMTLTLHLLCIISGTQAGMAALITHLAASSCAFTWMVIEWLHKGKPTIVGP
jgi:ammonia channel protein AmtB